MQMQMIKQNIGKTRQYKRHARENNVKHAKQCKKRSRHAKRCKKQSRHAKRCENEQKQMLVAFHAEMETQDSWKTEAFKEVLAEDAKSPEGLRRCEEDLMRIQEMLVVNHRGRAKRNGVHNVPRTESAARAVIIRYHSGIMRNDRSVPGVD